MASPLHQISTRNPSSGRHLVVAGSQVFRSSRASATVPRRIFVRHACAGTSRGVVTRSTLGLYLNRGAQEMMRLAWDAPAVRGDQHEYRPGTSLLARAVGAREQPPRLRNLDRTLGRAFTAQPNRPRASRGGRARASEIKPAPAGDAADRNHREQDRGPRCLQSHRSEVRVPSQPRSQLVDAGDQGISCDVGV